MIIKLSGLLVDKFVQKNVNRSTGEIKESLKAVIYQYESHKAINVTVLSSTYSKLEPLKNVTIECEIGSFVSNGNAIQYFKEVDA